MRVDAGSEDGAVVEMDRHPPLDPLHPTCAAFAATALATATADHTLAKAEVQDAAGAASSVDRGRTTRKQSGSCSLSWAGTHGARAARGTATPVLGCGTGRCASNDSSTGTRSSSSPTTDAGASAGSRGVRRGTNASEVHAAPSADERPCARERGRVHGDGAEHEREGHRQSPDAKCDLAERQCTSDRLAKRKEGPVRCQVRRLKVVAVAADEFGGEEAAIE